MGKLTLLHINIIGILVAAILAGALFYFMIKPKNEEIDTTHSQAESTKQAGGTDQKITEIKHKLAATQKDARDTEAKWNVNQVKYMPALPYKPTTSDLDLYFFPPVGKSNKGQLYGFRDIPTVWGQWVTAWYDAQINQGVRRLPGTEFPIKEFEADPNKLTAILANHLTFPEDGKPWPVKLECKDFDAALNHLKRFNSMEKHGMPVIDKVAIAGQSPNLILSYDMAMYIIPRSAPPAIDPMIGGGTGAAGGAPGMPSGMPSGMPMSGGMMGGSGGAPMSGGGGKAGGGKAD